MSTESGKIAIVTGGARGIGRSIVLALGAKNISVAFTYVSASSATAAKSLCDEMRALGTRCVGIQCDSALPSAPSTIMDKTLQAFDTDKVDILVNNAGLGQNTPLKDITLEEYERLMNVNVRAVLFMTQAFIQHVKPGGRVVNLSSISARGGYATQSVYAASKAAVEGMTRVWAKELGQEYGITVNAVNPGPVDTEMYRAAGEVHLARMEAENAKTPAGARAGTPGDVADIVCFLCSEKARWISGDVVCSNGGMLFT